MPRVVVVGAGVTGLAAAFRLARAGADVEVLDAGERAGGLLRTERRDGLLVEWAANGFLDNAPATLALAEDAGLATSVVRAAPASRERYLARGGRLVALPAKPPQLLTTPLLTLRGKLRLLREPRVPPLAPGAPEEALAAFVARRFGEEALPVADAMATGVFAGDPARLSLDRAFPRARELERAHGSVLRALARAPRGAAPATLASFADGMEALPRALAKALPAGALRMGERVARVAPRAGGGFRVESSGGARDADAVVVALAPDAAARVVEGFPPLPLAKAPVAVVALAWPRERAPGASGFGWLAPESEGRFALGGVFESNLFPGRAPEGETLVRALVGGVRHPERAAMPDDALVARVARDAQSLGVARGEPSRALVLRPGPIPQLDVGHGAWLEAAARLEAAMPGLRFAGVGWRAVAVNALVAEADALARDLAGPR